MKIVFVCHDFGDNSYSDGGTIFDRNLVSSLRQLQQVDLHCLKVQRSRAFGRPLWRTSVPRSTIDEIRQHQLDGALVVLSHEALFSVSDALATEDAKYMLIVHNFMPRFSFTNRPVLSALYRTGSVSYFHHHLERASSIFWLSEADFRVASEMMTGDWILRSFVQAPPPRQQTIGPRGQRYIHVDGTSRWRAKRLSGLTPRDLEIIYSRGFSISTFDGFPNRAFGLITDRFSVGYKLKLMQMLYFRDVIASFTDLEPDVRQVAPNYPFYHTVRNVGEALDYFENAESAVSGSTIEDSVQHLEGYTWKTIAERLLGELIGPQRVGRVES